MVPEKDASLLIHEIEAAERRKYLDIEQEDNLDPEVMSPEVPRRIFKYMAEEHDLTKGTLPWNRRTRRRLC